MQYFLFSNNKNGLFFKRGLYVSSNEHIGYVNSRGCKKGIITEEMKAVAARKGTEDFIRRVRKRPDCYTGFTLQEG